MSSNTSAFTIVNNAYMHFAITAAQSYIERNPTSVFYIFLLDHNVSESSVDKRIKVTEVTSSLIPDLAERSRYYEITELSTSIKPDIMLYLMEIGYKAVLYFDPDICFYDSVDHVFALLKDNDIIVTPHSTTPVYDGKRPDDLNFLRAGTFNLGFIGVASGNEGRSFLKWWAERLTANAFSSFSMGMFTDQKWLDLMPCYFDSYYILKDGGYNMAYWNLHERTLTSSNGTVLVNNKSRLVFFQFSGIDINGEEISKYQTRLEGFPNQELEYLFSEYRKKVQDNKKTLNISVSKVEQKVNDLDRLLYFHNYMSEHKKNFSYDERVVQLGNRIARLPFPINNIVRRIAVKMLSDSTLRNINNSVNKINISYLISRLKP